MAFDKADGNYLAQWMTDGDEMDGVRGMYVIPGSLNKKGTKRADDTLVWVTPSGIYRAPLPLG